MSDLRVMSMFACEAPRVPTVAICKHAKCNQYETLLKSKNIFLQITAGLDFWKNGPAIIVMTLCSVLMHPHQRVLQNGADSGWARPSLIL
jgi:hypothetical protein